LDKDELHIVYIYEQSGVPFKIPVPPIEKKKSRHYCLVTQETINCGRNDRIDISRENKFKIEDGIYSTVKTNVLIPKQIYWFKFKDTEEFHIGKYLSTNFFQHIFLKIIILIKLG
jgi:hypothetical protein